jgi:hypothetical protein
MRLLSRFAAPSAIAILSTALLCGTAVSQTATGSGATLPDITVQAPKQVARPQQVETSQRPNTVSSRRTSVRTQSSISHVAWGPPGSVLSRLGSLEKSASSCNGGCETSFKTGNAPWVGCSFAGGWWSTYSPTCTDTLTYTSYLNCMETKLFLSWENYKARWYCHSLMSGGKFKVAEVKRSGLRH